VFHLCRSLHNIIILLVGRLVGISAVNLCLVGFHLFVKESKALEGEGGPLSNTFLSFCLPFFMAPLRSLMDKVHHCHWIFSDVDPSQGLGFDI
jgi:hypothetical protein